MNRETESRSVYTLGASDGLWVGVLMGLCMFCMIMSSRLPVLSLAGIVIFLVTPFVVWRMLRRSWIRSEVPTSFSAVWLHGICIFLFGSLIMALMMYLTLKFLTPGWIENQVHLASLQLAQNVDTLEQSRMLERVIESGNLPSAIYTSVSAIWLAAFTGSMWSMIFALILTRTGFYRKLRENRC